MNYIQIKEKLINFDNVCQMEIKFDGSPYSEKPYTIYIFYGNNVGNTLEVDVFFTLTKKEFDAFNQDCKQIGIVIDLTRIDKYNV